MTTTLSSKGQVVIPLEIRRKLALPEGAIISCEVIDGKIVLDPEPARAKATLIDEEGKPVLVAPHGAPGMTPELVNEILNS
ncbi:MAG: AbrB/MazE/SpoVT family DNA-binding domain-containing protein [Verrucomicrobia bacterium]|nr:AbrB/MazE/SpoVT family DNA-binding domain-containing protein [Verrucomicrobiota bacterium]